MFVCVRPDRGHRPPGDAASLRPLSVASGEWTGSLHYWLRIDGRWYGYVIGNERRDVQRLAVLPVSDIRPMEPTPCQVRMQLGWAAGTVEAWRRRRGRAWEAKVTVYAGRRGKSIGTNWYPIDRLKPGQAPSGGAAWRP